MSQIFALLLIFFALAVGGILAMAAIKPTTFRIERSVTIEAPPDRIFPLINDLRAMNAWNPFAKGHPETAMMYSGPESGKGAAYAWDIPGRGGQGRVETTDAAAPTRVDMSLLMLRPMQANNQIRFNLQPSGSSTTVNWAMSGPWPYLHRVIGTVCNTDKMVGGMFEQGLRDLKTAAETGRQAGRQES